MQIIDWKLESRRFLFALLLMGAVGWLFSITAWLLFLTTFVYSGWLLFRIQRWHCSNSSLPVQRGGHWAEKQAAVDYLQDSFASTEDGTVMIDDTGAISWSNTAAEKLLGLRFPEHKSQKICDLINAPEFIRYFENRDYAGNLDMHSPNNGNFDLQLSIRYFGQGNRLLFARDVTETNRLQKMRTDFVANVSHELRTPLTVINGYLHTLADNGLEDEVRCQRAIQQMLGQAQRMESLIKDLIVLSRLESVPEVASQQLLSVRPMLELIRQEVMSAGHGERQIIIECDDSIQLQGNREELHSAFANLLMNAAKYTPEQGEIRLRWYEDKMGATLAVEDNGEGIEAHHIPRLTERFYRVDKSRSVETGGTGLGLAIVKYILIHHQAALHISSTLGEGSHFSCHFPRSRIFSSADAHS